eukprot:COSAG01_NODE_647_length_14531_cov_61.773489_4_plen_67_part_00
MQSALWPPTTTFTHNHMRPTRGGGCNSNVSELPLVKYIIYAHIRVHSIHNIDVHSTNIAIDLANYL